MPTHFLQTSLLSARSTDISRTSRIRIRRSTRFPTFPLPSSPQTWIGAFSYSSRHVAIPVLSRVSIYMHFGFHFLHYTASCSPLFFLFQTGFVPSTDLYSPPVITSLHLKSRSAVWFLFSSDLDLFRIRKHVFLFTSSIVCYILSMPVRLSKLRSKIYRRRVHRTPPRSSAGAAEVQNTLRRTVPALTSLFPQGEFKALVAARPCCIPVFLLRKTALSR
jgi:hypothetical protein